MLIHEVNANELLNLLVAQFRIFPGMEMFYLQNHIFTVDIF